MLEYQVIDRFFFCLFGLLSLLFLVLFLLGFRLLLLDLFLLLLLFRELELSTFQMLEHGLWCHQQVESMSDNLRRGSVLAVPNPFIDYVLHTPDEYFLFNKLLEMAVLLQCCHFSMNQA